MWWNDREKRLRAHGPNREKTIIFAEALLLCLLCLSFFLFHTEPGQAAVARANKAASALGLEKMLPQKEETASPSETKAYIKWVDFTVTCEAMNQAFRYDVDTCQADVHLNWVDLLAYLGARYGGDFSRYKPADMTQAAE